MTTRAWWWIRGLFLAGSFLSMLWLSVGIQDVFASPDERANAFFSQTFAENMSFCVQEPLNDIALGLIHPRSTVAPGTCILPASFLGFPMLNGFVMMVFGLFGSPAARFASMLVTPLLAAVAIAAWWWSVRRFSRDDRLADLAAFFVVMHPAWWYYGTRVMMHNVPFVALLMIGFALAFWAVDRRSRAAGFFSGIVLGVGLTMRLVELPLFFAISVLALFACVRREHLRTWYRHPFFFSAIGGSVIFLGYLLVSQYVYGSWFATGYTLPDIRMESIADTEGSEGPSLFDRGLSLLLPFGFHPRAMVRNVLQYGVQLYPVLSVLALSGMGIAWNTGKRAWRVFVMLLLCAALWMASVYGSWSVVDNIDPRAVTVGNSHVRYWIPLFVGASVFAGLAIRTLMQRSRVASIVSVGILLAVGGTSAQTVFGGTDGLIATRAALLSYEEKRDRIFDLTQCNTLEEHRPVIIVDHADKFLFPYCRVMVPLRSDSTYRMMPTLVDVVPLYYFGVTLPDTDLEYLNTQKLSSMGLKIEWIETLSDQSLYRILKADAIVVPL